MNRSKSSIAKALGRDSDSNVCFRILDETIDLQNILLGNPQFTFFIYHFTNDLNLQLTFTPKSRSKNLYSYYKRNALKPNPQIEEEHKTEITEYTGVHQNKHLKRHQRPQESKLLLKKNKEWPHLLL